MPGSRVSVGSSFACGKQEESKASNKSKQDQSASTGHRGLAVPGISDVDIGLRRLPPSFDGFSIVQLTDVHIGNTIGEAFVRTMVERVNQAEPDLIAITGDLVDGRLSSLQAAAEPLRDLRAKHGVFFVTGNHEYYSGVDPWLTHLRSLGIRVLRNEREAIDVNGHGFDIAGVDDHSSGRFQGHGPDIAAAMHGRDPNREVVLLAHQPKQVHEAKKHDIGLQLSGHTHGGQIWPWHYLVKLQQRGLIRGLSKHGDTQLYISQGTGYWGPPIRFLTKSEITRVRLRSIP
jgi:predicted MPP superfamily phosphohydrolase